MFDSPILRNIVLKGILDLAENEEIVESTLLFCKLLPGPFAHQMGQDEKNLKTDDLRSGRVMELDFLFHLRIEVRSPEGDLTYRYLYANIECQRYPRGYMLEKGLSHATRILSNSFSEREDFFDQTSVMSVFLTYNGLTANPKENPDLSSYRKSFRFSDYDSEDPDKTIKEYGNIRVDIIDLKRFDKTFDELVTYQDKILFILSNYHKLNKDQLRAIEKHGGNIAALAKAIQEIEQNPEFAKEYLDCLVHAEADEISHRDTATYARREGRKEGAYNTKIHIALNLLKGDSSIADIAMNTGLSEQKVSQLKKNLVK